MIARNVFFLKRLYIGPLESKTTTYIFLKNSLLIVHDNFEFTTSIT